MTELKNNLFMTYFETYNFDTTQKWVYVSNEDDNDVVNNHIDAFQKSDWNARNFTNAFIVSQESFDNTVLPIIREIGSLLGTATLIEEDIMYTTKELKTWILTDDDCFQHMKKLSSDNKQWRMVQIYGTPDEKSYSGYVDIDLDDYLNPTEDYEAQIIIDILSGYGYDEFIFGVDFDAELEHYKLIIDNIKEIYGDNYLQIVAECVCEYMVNPDDYIIKPSDATSFEEAKKKTYEFMKGEDD